MIVVLPGGKALVLFMMTVMMICIDNIISSNCPLLRSFMNDTGILLINKTTMMETSSINCQWLIAGSAHQRILVEFDYVLIPISITEYLHFGCRRGAIHLWTPGLEHEKVEICGDRRHIRVAGVGQALLIELRLTDPNLDANLLMHYQLIQIEQPLSTPSNLINSNTFSSHEYAECGLTSTSRYQYYRWFQGRIVGGRQAVPHSHPWQVLLNNRGKFCGAAVLNANWLATAAHCVNGSDPNDLLAELGMHDRYSPEKSRVTRAIKEIVVYPSYSGKSTRWMHDIALLRLFESVAFNPFIRAVCLPAAQDLIRRGDQTLVTGWGETLGTGNFRFLREVEVPIQSNDQCGLSAISSTTSLCAGLCTNSTCDACQGDSGGPMVTLRNGRWHLVGLISWGFSCAGLGVYTKISYYTEWISKIIYN